MDFKWHKLRKSLHSIGSHPVFQDGPPDLDKILRDFFNFKSKSAFERAREGRSGHDLKPIFLPVMLGIVLLYLLLGLFKVDPAEKAVITTFGRYSKTLEPGLHYHFMGFQRKYIVDVQKVTYFTLNERMLTSDENIVEVSIAIAYRKNNPQEYLFNTVHPEALIENATSSALRQAVGHSRLDSILTTGRDALREKVSLQLEKTMDSYHAGLLISDINLQHIQPPQQVTTAFDDAIKAREDKVREINQAQAYAEKQTPVARGQAERYLKEAEADKERLIMEAEAKVSRLTAWLPAYNQQPDLTMERIYLETMTAVLQGKRKFYVSSQGNVNLFTADQGLEQFLSPKSQADAEGRSGFAQEALKRSTPSTYGSRVYDNYGG